VKIIKVILLVGLICKAAILPSMDFSCFMSDSCHMEASALDTSNPDHHSEEDGCCNTGCDCLCCGHVFTMETAKSFQLSSTPVITTIVMSYNFAYAHTFSKGVWQPPRFS